MNEVISTFLSQIAATSPAEWVAVILAVGYVFLAARENPWCWACALLSTAIYTWLFWQVSLPFQSALNLFYMVMAVYGYYKWHGGIRTQSELAIRSLHWWHHLILVPCVSGVAYVLATLAASQFSNTYLYLDASIHLFSVVTTFMVAHKYLQNWVYWFFINMASAYLYWQSELVLSACLFAGYVGFSVYGYVRWRRQWNKGDGSALSNRTTQGNAQPVE
ncbi:nicotinamide riboside transporter PnuC [Alteromonas halophila]|uniref:Nicotinamide riboside transporter PnuC n=1 Tax=Alteromonas halophila TaxID=516698 RepID=A0A918MUP7_9ALTE|nr:nicotinamide riboside transporter PnuC [Alteromonas halophila]GGW74139.1 nicotinamide mononucleotide transporter [Alteromonas halophila]